jgi:chromosome segregation ATPase
MTESVGFQYWRDSSMLLGVSSKNQEKMREDWKNLMNENKFYLRKMKKMQKKMKEMEEESKVDKEFQEEVVQENKELQCKYDAERLARAPRLWNELKEENKKLKDRLHWKDKEIKAYEKGCETHREITDNLLAKIKKLEENSKVSEPVREQRDYFKKESFKNLEVIEKLQEELEKSQKNLIIANKELAHLNKKQQETRNSHNVLPHSAQDEGRTFQLVDGECLRQRDHRIP